MKIESVKDKIYEIIDKNIENGSIGVTFEDSAKDAIYESVKERLDSFLAYLAAIQDKSYDGTSEYENMYMSDLYKLIEREINQTITDQFYYGKIRLEMNRNNLIKQIIDDVVKEVIECPNPEENDHNKKIAVKKETKTITELTEENREVLRKEVKAILKEEVKELIKEIDDYDASYRDPIVAIEKALESQFDL